METIITMMLMMMVLIIVPPSQQQSHCLPLSAPLHGQDFFPKLFRTLFVSLLKNFETSSKTSFHI